MNHRFLLSILAFLLAIGNGLRAAEPPHIHTDRAMQKTLPLPKGDGVFHFIVFGDRTGGPVEGIEVLAQAVEDANLLDPDLVLTVGDLVNGYNHTDAWTKQMEEFQSTMGKLRMPWFPVAGNHDIYWRPSPGHPETKPPREHEDNYEKHFGPLWYWFEHKESGFLILFSDEGHPDGRARSFSDPEQQRISARQRAWIAAELEKMKHLKHVFVFLHHPYWWGERYPASNWNEVHQLLARNGNVRAVFAGHIHQMRYDGVRDGIGYYALATTGGSLTPGMQYRHFGLLHHFNVVTVRDNGYSVAAIPVGAVFDPKQFTPERLADVEAARYTLHEFDSPPIALGLDGSATATYRVAVRNPVTLPIDVTLLASGDKTWVIAPDHRHGKVEPGQRRVFEFACIREATPSLEGYEPPRFELRFDVLTPDARLAMPVWSLSAKTLLVPPEGHWPQPGSNQCLVLNGANACLEIDRDHIEPHDGPFTVEAWVRAAEDGDGSVIGNIHIGGFVLDVAGTPRFSVQTGERPPDARRAARISPWITTKATNKLSSGVWSHLAGVYDGAEIRLYINGRKAASAPAPSSRLDSDKSLFVGARPHSAWNVHNFSWPADFWKGSIDDVRISRGARYQSDFKPEAKLAPDATSVLVLANDQHFGAFVPVSSGTLFQALIQGGARFESAER